MLVAKSHDVCSSTSQVEKTSIGDRCPSLQLSGLSSASAGYFSEHCLQVGMKHANLDHIIPSEQQLTIYLTIQAKTVPCSSPNPHVVHSQLSCSGTASTHGIKAIRLRGRGRGVIVVHAIIVGAITIVIIIISACFCPLVGHGRDVNLLLSTVRQRREPVSAPAVRPAAGNGKGRDGMAATAKTGRECPRVRVEKFRFMC